MEYDFMFVSQNTGCRQATLLQTFHGYCECNNGIEHINPRNGVNPLDRSKWILYAHGAYSAE